MFNLLNTCNDKHYKYSSYSLGLVNGITTMYPAKDAVKIFYDLSSIKKHLLERVFEILQYLKVNFPMEGFNHYFQLHKALAVAGRVPRPQLGSIVDDVIVLTFRDDFSFFLREEAHKKKLIEMVYNFVTDFGFIGAFNVGIATINSEDTLRRDFINNVIEKHDTANDNSTASFEDAVNNVVDNQNKPPRYHTIDTLKHESEVVMNATGNGVYDSIEPVSLFLNCLAEIVMYLNHNDVYDRIETGDAKYAGLKPDGSLRKQNPLAFHVKVEPTINPVGFLRPIYEFGSLLDYIRMLLTVVYAESSKEKAIACGNCGKVFITENKKAQYCSPSCRNRANVRKSYYKKKEGNANADT